MPSFPTRRPSCALALVPLAGALLVSCAGAGAAGPRREPDTVRVARRDIEDVFLLTGELQAVRSEELTAPRVEGNRVQVKWLVEDGSEVAAGEPVAELDNSQVAQSLEDRRLRLIQAEIALEGREASLQAEASQKRLDLVKAETEVAKARIEAAVPVELRSRKEWNDKQQALRRGEAALQKAELAMRTFDASSKADVEVLRIARDKAAREVQVAERSLQQLSLAAPRAGIAMLGRNPMEDRPLQVGDNIWGGLRVVSIPDLQQMEVLAYLPEVDDGRVRPGLSARVVLETDLDRSFRGRVEEVAAVAQDARFAGGFKVRVSLEETDPRVMRPGLSARVEVVRRVFAGALSAPRSAFVWADGRWRLRNGADVKVATCLPLECVVESGLSEGQIVRVR
jgi:multidrug efflux pump subunit AcrA (membrane-fusion protein)